MKIIGYKRTNFKSQDGVEITGFNVYVENEINPQYGNGVQVDRIYLSDKKLERESISLDELLDKEVKIYYNRYGKPDSIVLVK